MFTKKDTANIKKALTFYESIANGDVNFDVAELFKKVDNLELVVEKRVNHDEPYETSGFGD